MRLKELNVKFKFYKCDIINIYSLKKTILKIGQENRKIDLLVNNAGIINKKNFEDITPELFNKTINVNLRAPLFTSQYALKYLIKSSDPCIINIASVGGFQNWSGFIPYSISKSGIIKLTYLLAKKLAPKIRVNAIAPGTIVIKGEEKGTPEKIPAKKIPLKKYGNPRDIIEAIRFILNCDYLTGHVIPVEGGRLL